MKKIISLLASAALAFSACAGVFAAAPADANPKVIVHEPVDLGSGKFSVTVDLTDLGTVQGTLDEDEEISGTLLKMFDYHINGDDLAISGKVSGGLSSAKADWSYSGNAQQDKAGFDGLLVRWLAGSVDTCYPQNEAKETACTAAATVKFTGTAGKTYTLSDARIGYDTFNAGTPGKTEYLYPKFYNEAGEEITSITLPGGEPAVKTLGLTIDGTDAKKENGYIWKLGLTQENGAQADSFTADFKDSTGLTNTKTARNEVSKFFGGEGTVEFYVGLKTARTITEFKATVADSTAAGVTASDTWKAE